jgi:hypothetical protein
MILRKYSAHREFFANEPFGGHRVNVYSLFTTLETSTSMLPNLREWGKGSFGDWDGPIELINRS